jgi:hypothetical protein
MDVKECAFVTISQKGQILSVDVSCGSMFGFTDPDELLGKNVNILIAPPYKVRRGGFKEVFFRASFSLADRSNMTRTSRRTTARA